MFKNKSTIAGTMAGVVFVTFLGKILSLVREALIANYYGASYVTDIYVLENGIVNAVCTVLLCVATTAFIPVFMNRRANNENVRLFAQNALVFFSLSSALLAIVLFFIPEIVLGFVAPGTFAKYDGSQLDLILLSLRLSFINIFLLSVQGALRALMQAYGKMILAAAQSLVLNCVLILYLTMLNSLGLIGLTFAMVVAQGSIVLLYFVRAIVGAMVGFEKVPIRSLVEDARELVKLAFPVMLMSILSQASYIVDRNVASGFAEGTMALIGYASTLALALNALFGESINNVVYPKLAEYASRGDEEHFSDLGKSVFVAASTLLIPMIIGMMVASEDVIRLVYGRGGFTESNVVECGMYLTLYLPGIYFFYLRDLLNRFCYSKHSTRVPSLCAAAGFILTIAFNMLLPRFMGSDGIVTAVTVAAFLSFVLEFVLIKITRIDDFADGWIRSVFVISLSAMLSLGLTSCMHAILDVPHVFRLAACLLTAFVSFAIIAVPTLKSSYIRILKGNLID